MMNDKDLVGDQRPQRSGKPSLVEGNQLSHVAEPLDIGDLRLRLREEAKRHVDCDCMDCRPWTY